MSPLIGRTLAHYRITAAIGAGGMGEVYRATDTKLGREVALKLLPEAFAADPDRLARFEREAKVLASLNHPGIAHLYGFESARLPDGSSSHFLAMELVEGEDLAERLKRGPIPVDEAVAIARQVADALEEAHEKGIVHRDLKPANVKVTPDGKVKVLDFGLAKAWTGAGRGPRPPRPLAVAHPRPDRHRRRPHPRHRRLHVPRAGPRQGGRQAHRRLGLRRRAVRDAERPAAVRRRHGERRPRRRAEDASPTGPTLPPTTPARVRQLLGRCLERDPKQRLRDIGEARVALGGATSPAEAAALPAAPARGTAASRWAMLAFVALVSAAAGIALFTRLRPAPPRAVTRLQVGLPPGQVLSGVGGPAISRDGRTLAYTARDATGVPRLYVRALDRFEASVVPESEGAQAPFFSPDGSRVGFFARAKLMTAAVAGGAPTPIADASASSLGGTWGDDDTIVYGPALSTGLLRVPSSGGKPQSVTQPDEAGRGYAHGRPHFLPGSRSVLFTTWGAPEIRGDVVVSLETGQWTQVTSGIWSARYARSGHLLLSGPRGIRAAPFDPDRPGPTSPQAFVVEEVYSTLAWADSWFSVSDNGTLAYVPGDPTLGRLAWVERDGRTTPVSDAVVSLADPSLSPDGERIAFEDRDDNLWAQDLRRGTRVRLTLDGEGSNAYPVWSRDGTRVLFASNRSGDWEIWSVPPAGGPATRLLTRKGNQFPVSAASDGTVLFNERAKGSGGPLRAVAGRRGDAVPRLAVQHGRRPVLAGRPRGRVRLGRDRARRGLRAPVRQQGRRGPGFYRRGQRAEVVARRARGLLPAGDAFLAATVTATGGALAVGDSRRLFETRAASGRSTLQAGYSVSPDGRRFLVLLLDPRADPHADQRRPELVRGAEGEGAAAVSPAADATVTTRLRPEWVDW